MFYSSASNWHQKLAPATGTRKLVSVYGPLVTLGPRTGLTIFGPCTGAALHDNNDAYEKLPPNMAASSLR